MGNGRMKVVFGVGILALLLVGVLIGVVVTSNTQKTQNIQTRAAQEEVGEVEIISPRPGEKISGTQIKARFETSDDVKNISSVYKISDDPAKQLTVERLDPEKVILSGTVDIPQLASGRHTLTIYIYSKQGGPNRLVGSSVFYFQK